MQDYKKIENICFLGAHQVGKTNLFNVLSGRNYFKPYQSTIKTNFHTRFNANGPIKYWDFPMEEATYHLGRQQQVLLVFNRRHHRTLNDLQAYLALARKHAPKAIISIIGITEQYSWDEISEEEIDAFLEQNNISDEYYLPILTSSEASIDSLTQHLDASREQPRNQTNTPHDKRSSPKTTILDRNSPSSVVNITHRFMGCNLSIPTSSYPTMFNFLSKKTKQIPPTQHSQSISQLDVS